MANQVSDKQKLKALKEMQVGLDRLVELGLVQFAPDGKQVQSTSLGNMVYLQLRKFENEKGEDTK